MNQYALKIEGEGLTVDREVPEDVVAQMVDTIVKLDGDDGESVADGSIVGPGFEMKFEASVRIANELIQILFGNRPKKSSKEGMMIPAVYPPPNIMPFKPNIYAGDIGDGGDLLFPSVVTNHGRAEAHKVSE